MKKILLAIICFLSVLCINDAVLAAEATCVYEDGYTEHYLTVTIKNKKLSLDYSLKKSKDGKTIVVKEGTLTISKFIKDEQYFCPPSLYHTYGASEDPSIIIKLVDASGLEGINDDYVLDESRSKVINDAKVDNPEIPEDEKNEIPNTGTGGDDDTNPEQNNGFFGNLEVIKCGDVEIPEPLPPITRVIVLFIKIAAPIVLIIMGMIDVVKAVTANDEKKIKDAQTNFVRRLVPAALIFLVVTIVQLLVGILADSTDESKSISRCIDCMISDADACNIIATNDNEESSQHEIPKVDNTEDLLK